MNRTTENCIEHSDTGIRRIGIMGGSFDPVHLGHVGLAKDSLHQADLDMITVIPASVQPFKQDVKKASGQDRINMLEIAFGDDPDIDVCNYELEQEGVSYTYLTLRAMKERFGQDAKIWFIVGTDSLLKLETWKNSDELLTEYSYIVGSRPGYMEEDLDNTIGYLEDEYGTGIIKIRNSLYDISSTQIREKVQKGEDISELVGKEVERYIKEHGLYR